MFSPSYGFKPRTRQEMVRQAYEIWKDLTGTKDTFSEFQGSNVHLLCNIFFQEIEKAEAMFSAILLRQFAYWNRTNLAIQGSFGSSFEGWQNRFSGLCTSLDIIASDDPRASSLEQTLKPGEIVIYFDDLRAEGEELQQAWRDCKNIAEPTPIGTETIDVVYSNGEQRTYKYNNLKPEKYTPLEVQINVVFIPGEMQYKNSDFEQELRKKFELVNRINRGFFVQTYIDVTQFVGVSDLTLKTKITGTDSQWVEGDREIDLGKKYTIRSVSVESSTY